METNPMMPRPRNRRSDRGDAPQGQQPMQQGVPAQQMPVQYPPQGAYQPTYPGQAQVPYPGQMQRPVQGYPQQMPPVYPGQMQPPQQGYPVQQVPVQRPMPQAMPIQQALPMQQALPVQQPVQPQYRPSQTVPPRPQAANAMPKALRRQQEEQKSIWQMPTPKEDVVQRRKERKADPPPQEEPAKKAKKLPVWLVTAMTLMLIAVMALFAMKNLMDAYLVTQEKERIAAYEAVLSNYHVTEKADGTRRVTWQDAIERYAAQYNLQPAFVTAIIRNESSFRTDAVSSVGARGLMQLMPDTAEWIAGKLNDGSYHFDNMFDAETNIRYGCWYLGYLSELFRGDPVLVCSAYHAGQGDVRNWLLDRSISPDGMTVPVDRVPIAETRQYAGRVTQAYGIYQTLLYTDDAQLPMYAADGGAAAAGR